jgi:hypothetical protein
MDSKTELKLARYFFKCSITVILIALASIVIFWAGALALVIGWLDIHSFPMLIEYLSSNVDICQKP